MRSRKSAILNDYLCYVQEVEYDLGDEDDPATYKQAVESSKSDLWQAAMSEELASTTSNHVWTLGNGSDTKKAIRCKWVFKTKRDARAKIERFKTWLVAKGFT